MDEKNDMLATSVFSLQAPKDLFASLTQFNEGETGKDFVILYKALGLKGTLEGWEGWQLSFACIHSFSYPWDWDPEWNPCG